MVLFRFYRSSDPHMNNLEQPHAAGTQLRLDVLQAVAGLHFSSGYQ